MNKSKVCTNCKLEQPLADFHKNKSNKDGLKYHCKKCVRQYGVNNRELIGERNHQFRLDNPEHSKQYRERPEVKERGRQYRLKTSEKNKRYQRQYYLDNIEKFVVYRNSPEVKERDKIKRQEPKRKESESSYWRSARGKEAQRASIHKRRAKKRQRPFQDISIEFITTLKEYYGDTCIYCKVSEQELGTKLTVDHYIPLAKGGSHVANNLMFACKSCNSSKNDSMPKEWMAKHSIDIDRVERLRAGAPICEGAIHEE